MSEFSGGAPDVAFENEHAVQISHFDPGSLDSLADLLRDCEITGESPWEVIQELFRPEIDARVSQALRIYADLLATSRRPELRKAGSALRFRWRRLVWR